MDDYSKYFENPSDFIKNYEIQNNEIIVNTKKAEKGKPLIKRATKGRIKHYEIQLEQQYKTVIYKRKTILQEKIDIKTIIYYTIAIVICILSIISSRFSDTLGMLLCGTSVLTLLISSIDNAIYTIKFKSKLKLYNTFIRERKQIEQSSELNENITKDLTNKTLKLLNKNKELKENNLIDFIFNIDFMDKASLKDLKKILYAYSINEGITESIIDENPSLKIISYRNKIKKRIRRKEEKRGHFRGCRYE